MNTIIGIFDDPTTARRALEELRDGPLMLEDVSIISRDSSAAGASSEDVSAGEGAAVGAVWGGLVGLAALLIPGVGAQGGDAAATVQAGWRADGPIVVNSSRAILYASSGDDFADAARREALKTRDTLQAARA